MKLILADAQTLVRAGLRALIEQVPQAQVIAETGEGQQLLAAVGKLHPDAVLTDLALPGIGGLELIAQLRRHYPQVAVLLVLADVQPHVLRGALKLGVQGVLSKYAQAAELPLALDALAQLQTYLSPSIAAAAIERRRNPRVDDAHTLTVRQRQVLHLIGRGKSTKEIAQLLGVSVKTVETHRLRAMQTLDLHSINALMRYALDQGLDQTS